MANQLVNVELFRAGVDAKLNKARKLLMFVEQESAEGLQVGTFNVVTNEYIGDAEVIAAGSQIPLSQMQQAKNAVTFEKLAKGVAITDEERKQAFGDPVANAENQTALAIDRAAEDKVATLLKAAQFSVEVDALDTNGVLEAIGVMGEGIEDAPYFLAINPVDFASLQRELKASDNTALNNAVYGATFVLSTKVVEGEAYLIQEGAIKEVVQKDTDVEVSRNAGKKQDEVYTDKIHAVFIQDQSKIVRLAVTVV